MPGSPQAEAGMHAQCKAHAQTLCQRRHIMQRLLAAMVGAASIGLALSWTFTQARAEGAKVEVSEKEPFGKYLTDAEGMSLYLFEADGKLNSTCYEACAQAWPPLVTEGEPTAGEGLDKGMLATFERTDGSTQVAYNGRPLYYFARDGSAGDTKGQDIEGFGAEWYLVSPEGEKVEEEE
jgi:predicted lipoprotein with Yx(FWY)xxD motif